MKLEKEIGLYTNEELEAILHEKGHFFIEYESGDRLSIHKFEVIGTKDGGATVTQYLEKSLEDKDSFTVNQPEYFPLHHVNKAFEAMKLRAVSQKPFRAWPAYGGGHTPYSMYEVREMLNAAK